MTDILFAFDYSIEQHEMMVDGIFVGLIDLVAVIDVDRHGEPHVSEWMLMSVDEDEPHLSIEELAQGVVKSFWRYVLLDCHRLETLSRFRRSIEEATSAYATKLGIVLPDPNDEHRLGKRELGL